MNSRLLLLLLLVYTVLGLYGLRLWQLQVVEYEQYSTQSRGNYVRTEPITAPRGRIFDRNGKLIADNRMAVDLVYQGGEVEFKERILALLGLSELPKPERGQEVIVKANLPEGLIPTLAELTAGQKNLRLVERLERNYPRPISGSVLGYVQLANALQVKQGYDPDELVGVSGLEGGLENTLRGTRGARLVEVNARGERIRSQVIRPPLPGKDVYLTLDYDLQKAAEKALADSLEDLHKGRKRYGLPLDQKPKGAIIAVDPRTGEVLAMATAPTFDPNLFARRPTPREEIQRLIQDPDKPLFNRAVLPYAPGSTFKLVTSSMLLEKGYATPGTIYTCTAAFTVGRFTMRNWAHRNMGPMTVKGAIANSCNTWYFQAVWNAPPGSAPLVDDIAARAKELGIGRPTGLEIPERSGFLPTRAWKRATFDEPWYPGETLSVAIGQGPVLATPAEIARMLSTIAMSGRQPELHLVKRIGDTPISPRITQVPGTHWAELQEGLRQTVTEGTASFQLKDFPVPTAGKTGTAEIPGKRMGLSHAWYMGYGPVDPNDPRPPLLVVAFFENGGEGSGVALPAAKKVMSAFWKVNTGSPTQPSPAPIPQPTPPSAARP